MRTLILTTATTALLTTPALAQVPSQSASFTGESIMTTPEGTIAARLYGVPGKLRTDAYFSGMSTVNVMDLNREEVLSWSPDSSSGMGTMAMRMNYGEVSRKYGYSPEPDVNARMIGSDNVAGHSCNIYEHQGTTACVTYDGIVLRTRSPEGYGTEMRSLQRGPQPASYFEIPAGYTVMDPTDFGSMMGSLGGFGGEGGSAGQSPDYGYGSTTSQQSGYGTTTTSGGSGLEDRLGRAVERETSDRVDDAVSDRAGGVIGGVVGDEAGKVLGGLFGKKKKKKKKKRD